MGIFDKKKKLDDDDDSGPRPTPPIHQSSSISGTFSKVQPHAPVTPPIAAGYGPPAAPPMPTVTGAPVAAPHATGTPAHAPAAPLPTLASTVTGTPAPAPKEPDVVFDAPHSLPPSEAGFGIDDAVQLMRQLPSRDVDLVMQVVKKTLESVRVDIGRIIDGASRREHAIEDRVKTLSTNIQRLEAEIASNQKEISTLEATKREITTVKERLLIAQRQEAGGAAAAATKPAAPPATPPPPEAPST